MKIKKTIYYFISILILICNLTISIVPVHAEPTSAEEAIEAHKALPISSNEIENWPEGPVIGAESACLLDVETGTILYDKNMDMAEYPASTTKVMTCLLAAENCSMDEIVTFSKEAVFGIEPDSSNVGMDVGQSITMEEAIYCIMLASANEVASAVAEHVGGDIDSFAEMMNKKAAELGCTNTHFVNANGLHNDEHYTTAHDLALITAEYFKNEQLRKIASTTYYEVEATPTQPDSFGIANHHKMLPGKPYEYEYIIGGKTGYTNRARQTLVSCAEKDGMMLVTAVMRDEAPYQYTDTRDLFNYGFENFKKYEIAENETRYNVDNANFFHTNNNLFGNTRTFFTVKEGNNIILPITADFSDADSTLTYNEDDENILAGIDYSFNNIPIGSGSIILTNPKITKFEFGAEPVKAPIEIQEEEKKSNVIFVNYLPILIGIGIVIFALFIIFIIIAILKNYSFALRRRRNIKKRSRRYKSEFDDFDF